MQYSIGFIATFERPCWGYMSHRLDFVKSWFFFIFRNIDFCDTSNVLRRFWFSQIAKSSTGVSEFWILAMFLCVFWTHHEILVTLWPPPFCQQNCPGEGALDHDSIESQQPHNYTLTMASLGSHTPLSPRARRIYAEDCQSVFYYATPRYFWHSFRALAWVISFT